MDASNEMMDGEGVRAGLDCSAPHLYCASSSEPMRCSQVVYCVVCCMLVTVMLKRRPVTEGPLIGPPSLTSVLVSRYSKSATVRTPVGRGSTTVFLSTNAKT